MRGSSYVTVKARLSQDEYRDLRRYAKLSKRSTASVAGSLIATALSGADDPEPLRGETGCPSLEHLGVHDGDPCAACGFPEVDKHG